MGVSIGELCILLLLLVVIALSGSLERRLSPEQVPTCRPDHVVLLGYDRSAVCVQGYKP